MPDDPSPAPRSATALLVAVALVGLGACSEATTAPGGPPSADDPGPIHIHGLGVNPGDGMLYAATHTGLFRISDGEGERVGESRRDIMGFAVLGPDRFISSGHPEARERDLPVLLGLMESTDAGETWEEVSLLGEVDFHVLRHVHERIYGYDSTGERIMVSRDGRVWQVRSSLRLLDVAVDPARARALLAATPEGLLASDDGGRTWSPVPGAGWPPLVLLEWEEDGLWGAAMDGAVMESADRGRSWERRGSLRGFPEALLAEDGGLYGAAHGLGVMRSGDRGSTWEPLWRPEPQGP